MQCAEFLELPRGIAEQTVVEAMSTVNGTTFAKVVTVTNVKPAAANKDKNIQKVTVANVQLFSTAADKSPYVAAIERQTGIENFQVSESPFEHLTPYSLVRNKKSGKLYLYAIYNSAKSEMFIDGTQATKEQVAELLTPSEAKKLLEGSAVRNVKNDVEHDVVVRTISLDNIVGLQVAGKTY